MARVILVNLGSLPIPGNRPVYPVGAVCVLQALTEAGHDTRIVDFVHDPAAEGDLAWADDADVIGYAVRDLDPIDLAVPSFVPHYAAFASRLRDRLAGNRRRPLLIGGGPGFSLFATELGKLLGLDVAIRGEGEAVACKIASDPQRFRDAPSPPLVCEEGSTGFGETAVDHPAELLEAYNRSPGSVTIGVETRRAACIRRCGYCPYAFIDRSALGSRRGSRVQETIELLYETGVRSIFFTDAVFNDDPELAKEILRQLGRAQLPDLRWSAYFVPARFDDEFAGLIAETNHDQLIFSPDSFHRPTMHRLGKSFSLQRVRMAHEICIRHGLRARWSLLFGLPFETEESVTATAAVANAEFGEGELNLNFGVRLLPGTRFATQMELSPERLLDPVFYPIRDEAFGWVFGAFEQRFLDAAGPVRLFATRASLSRFSRETCENPIEDELDYVLVGPKPESA